jgi:hypothetical protein
MRSSLQKLLESKLNNKVKFNKQKVFISLACEIKNPTMNQYLNALDNSSWLQHIKSVIDAAIFIARVQKIESLIS